MLKYVGIKGNIVSATSFQVVRKIIIYIYTYVYIQREREWKCSGM